MMSIFCYRCRLQSQIDFMLQAYLRKGTSPRMLSQLIYYNTEITYLRNTYQLSTYFYLVQLHSFSSFHQVSINSFIMQSHLSIFAWLRAYSFGRLLSCCGVSGIALCESYNHKQLTSMLYLQSISRLS